MQVRKKTNRENIGHVYMYVHCMVSYGCQMDTFSSLILHLACSNRRLLGGSGTRGTDYREHMQNFFDGQHMQIAIGYLPNHHFKRRCGPGKDQRLHYNKNF